MDSWAKIKAQPDADLLKTLAAPDLTDRVEARKELVRRGPKARDLVLKKFVSGNLDGNARLVAIGVLTANWNADVEDLFRLLINDESADVRRLAVDGLAYNAKPKDDRVYETLVKALADREPAVRRAAALGIGRLGHDGSGDALVNSLRQRRRGRRVPEGRLRPRDRAARQAGHRMRCSRSPTPATTRTRIWQSGCSSRSAPSRAPTRSPNCCSSPHVTADQREALVRSYTNYQFDPPISLDPLADYLAKRPNEPVNVLLAAVDVFTASGDAVAPKAAQLVLNLLNRTDEPTRIAAILAIEASRMSAAAPKLIEFIGDPNRTQVERVAAVKASACWGPSRPSNPSRSC